MDEKFFDAEKKARMFDEIAVHYYERNFGTFSKTDMDLLMFRFYMDRLTEQAKDGGEVIDYNRCSDYKISKDLGITQQRIRNLKVRKELVYPTKQEDDWEKEFTELVENARYDETNRKIFVNIPDPNLYLEVQNFLEERGGYIEKQLNGKLLVIRAEYFIELVVNLSDESSRKKVIRQLKKLFQDTNKDYFDENHIARSLIDAAVNLSEVAVNLTGTPAFASGIGAALLSLLKHP